MNTVYLTGRLTKDPDCRRAADGALSIARFTLAVKKTKIKEGEPEAEFIPIVCFGKLAENVAKYVHKGRLIAVTGRIQIGSYEKEGKKIYTTDIIANAVEFLSANPVQKQVEPEIIVESAAEAPTPETAEPKQPDAELTTLTSDETPF